MSSLLAGSNNSIDEGLTVEAGLKDDTFRLRSYQAEMVEDSLKNNIIVAMDTGSGKTHIALARTAAELELCRPDQLVWFLAPTVTLCEQQFEVFKSNLPSYGIEILSGKDNVDHWSTQSIWDSVFQNTRIVLSTHRVLLDALTHGFVKMEKLALLIFDEAHHCVLNHPANLIMVNFYMPLVGKDDSSLPRILGLSASPVMKASATKHDLQTIEENLNATSRTPKVHRSELIRFVHRPQLRKIIYPPVDLNVAQSPLLISLIKSYWDYDLSTDPYVVGLLEKQQSGHDCSSQIQKVYRSDSTYCRKQLKNLTDKGKAMLEELGISPTDWYLRQCLSQFNDIVLTADQPLFDGTDKEKQHLLTIFKNLPSFAFGPLSDGPSLNGLSPKLEILIDLLVSEASDDFTGLIFVEQRVWVAVLAEVLCIHPRTKDLFNIGTFVGTSTAAKRKTGIADLAEPQNQQNTLDEFRAGAKNLILATSVLEEGIDVSSCHLVICFESPKNLKSFIQRRGRARKQESKYVIFTPPTGIGKAGRWEDMEEEMKNAYLNNMREVKAAEEKELIDEDYVLYYEVPNTSALLTSDNASQHLHHFCALLASGPYVDSRPQFLFNEDKNGFISAKVILPISVDPAVRKATSERRWETERMAKKDAAFQAYKALHQAGLVNDNLLPAYTMDDEETAQLQVLDSTPSLIDVSAPHDPWIAVAECQSEQNLLYHRQLIKLQGPGQDPLYIIIATPCAIPVVSPFLLHWNSTIKYTVSSLQLPSAVYTEGEITTMHRITRDLLCSVFFSRMDVNRLDFLWLLTPCNADGSTWDHLRLESWRSSVAGEEDASYIIKKGQKAASDWGWVRFKGDSRRWALQSFTEIPVGDSKHAKSMLQLNVIQAPKRRDFLHVISDDASESKAHTRVESFDVVDCVVSNLPLPYSVFALFVPSILNKYETYIIADALRKTILEPLPLLDDNLPLLVQAMTSSGTGEEDNYQRLEFLGDCILKLITSVHLMAAHLTWPESFLTAKKGNLVSNGTLARSTMALGLDKYILTKRFTGSKWAPRYAGDVLNRTTPPQPTTRSTKLLADVIESLIGTCYVLNGLPAAFTCTKTLLPNESWLPIPEATEILFSSASTDYEPQNLETLENLVDHTFTKKLLLQEAMTHGSYNGPLANVRSYERLEFLGDAVLDYIVSIRLYTHEPALSHQRMHAIRTAMVNASFLTFCMFETITSEASINKTTFEQEFHERALWQYLRYGDVNLGTARDAAVKQHAETRGIIWAALENDANYPWQLLALNDAPKFLSDIVESVIGAVYVDSKGSIEACERFVEKLGILGWLQRVLNDGVDCLHPKERLGHLAVEKDVKYVAVSMEKAKEAEGEEGGASGKGWRKIRNKNNGSSGKKRHRVQVKVGGVDVGGVEEGVGRLNAETIAAYHAVRILEGGIPLPSDVQMAGVATEDAPMHDARGDLVDEGGGEIHEEDEDIWHDAEEE